MSVDLVKAMKKRKPRQPIGVIERALENREEDEKKKRAKSGWSFFDIYRDFIDLNTEDLYDNLVNYRLSLDPSSQKTEIAALIYVTHRLPYPLVNKFINFMAKEDYQKFSLALEKFIEFKKIREAIEKSKQLIRKRKAVPEGVYVDKPRYNDDSPINRIMTEGSKQCLSNYKRALWVPAVVGEPIIVEKIVMRKRVLVPEIRGKPSVTNERWLRSEIRNGWYSIDESWYEKVCRFGRPWHEETVGYLLKDGRILEEDKRLYDASSKWLVGQIGAGSNSCKDYETAPWVKGLYKVFKIVAKKVPETRMYLKNRVKGGWYTLKPEWYTKACLEGRPFIRGAIGYLLTNGKIVTEGKAEYILASLYRNGAPEKKFERPEISTACVNDILTPSWVKNNKGMSPIGMVAHDVAETKDWIVPIPISNTDWYNLKRSWYVNACENGRKWLPGVFGYRMASGEIFPETREMFDSYIDWAKKGVVPLRKKVRYALPTQKRKRFEEKMDVDEAEDIEMSESVEEEPKRKKRFARGLVPDLLSSIKRDIAAGDTIYCDQCNKNVANPKFKTIYKGNTVDFCSTECFEDFKF